MKIPHHEIGFDLDGVIADTGEAFIRLACEEFDYCSFRLEDITSFQVEDCLGISTDTAEQIFYAILKDSLGTGLLPFPGAVEVITDMARLAPVTIINTLITDSEADTSFLEKLRNLDIEIIVK